MAKAWVRSWMMRGALAVILADDDDCAALHPRRGEVRERVRRDIGADRRFPNRRAAHRVVDRRRKHRRRARLVGGRREMHAQFVEQRLGVAQHVHQVRHRRALIARDVADARLEQPLGDGEDALALEHSPAPLRSSATSLVKDRSMALLGAAGTRPSTQGRTAVASISTRARGSTRRTTSTAVMAGKCRPITRRYASPIALSRRL